MSDESAGRNRDTELPEGWIERRLGDGLVVGIQPGFACGINSRGGTGIPHLRPMNVSQEGEIRLDDLKLVPAEEAEQRDCWLEAGDVLFNNTNSPALVGKTAYYALEERRAFSNHMTRVRCQPLVLDPEYCALALHQRWREGYFQAVCNNHVSQASVSREPLLDTPILVPTLAEQRRIVARYRALSAQIRKPSARLVTILATIARFRKSVLAAACSGQLTEDWRSSNTGLQSASVELAQCRQARTQSRQSGRNRRRGSTGVPEVEMPQELPNTWVLRKVKDLVDDCLILDLQDGNHGELYPRKSEFGDSGVPFITATQVLNNRVDFRSAPLLGAEKAKQLRIGWAQPGDVLLTHNATVGRVAVLPHEAGKCVLGTSVTYYRLNPQYLLPEFLCLAMQASFWQEQLSAIMEQTTRNQVSITKQVEFWLLVPPAAEQQEIVRRVEALFRLADAVERRVAAARERVERLQQAILAKAFRGELVPTEAELARREGREYEPASVLLERIRRERASQAGTGSGNGRRSAPRTGRRAQPRLTGLLSAAGEETGD